MSAHRNQKTPLIKLFQEGETDIDDSDLASRTIPFSVPWNTARQKGSKRGRTLSRPNTEQVTERHEYSVPL